MIHLTAATFVLVFARAIQQQNVIGGHYLAAGITPYLIALGEVATILWIVDAGTWATVPWIGTGGALASLAAMAIHRTLTRRTK